MPRSSEVVRQWEILRALEVSRLGETIHSLAAKRSVSTRTIRRDLDALQQAGFPVYDEVTNGARRWRLHASAFKSLAQTGFTLSELSAMYFSRALLERIGIGPFSSDLRAALGKVERILTPGMRKFIERLPGAIAAKPEPARRATHPRHAELVARLLRATLERRRAEMRYYSFSSRRVGHYTIDPHRLIYAPGGLYLYAYVREYRQMRTFAVERIRRLAVLDEHFEPPDRGAQEAFAHSLGANTGKPERIEIEFPAGIAPYIKERRWHPSQQIRDRPDGSIVLELRVANDWALRAWVLSFGPYARVVRPGALAERILDELEEARIQYMPRLEFESAATGYPTGVQPGLPLDTRAGSI